MELTGGTGDFLVAFGAGLISFLSPCVLPLIPVYLAFVTGMSPSELSEGKPKTMQVLVPSLLFVLGFSLVFVALGASASAIGSLLLGYRDALEKVLAVFLVLMGLVLLGVVRFAWLEGGLHVDLAKARRFGRGAAFALGLLFPFGLGACAGPILGAMLAMGMSSGRVAEGAVLLGVYSAGLAVPFLVTGILFARLRATLRWFATHSVVINRVAGALLVAAGVLMLFGLLEPMANRVLRYVPTFGAP